MFKIFEVADKLEVSKVTIYNKIKVLNKDIKPFIHKLKGVTYIDETGIEIIKANLDSKNTLNNFKTNSNSNNSDMSEDADIINRLNTFNESVTALNKDYISSLKDQISNLQKELDIKNNQLESKDKLIENFQVLMKDDKEKILLLEDQVVSQSSKKNIFKRLFNL